ncbi:MAG: ArnT family glycosyltransferase [Vulcanimicrobiota bacterium]
MKFEITGEQRKKYTLYFWLFIALVLVFRLFYIGFAPLQLTPEEAYYWNYSQHPDWSYFDHPPMVAWIIFIFTRIFGNNEFGVRVGAVLLSAGFSYLVFLIGRKLYNEQIGFYSVLLVNLAFIYNLYSTGITPDSSLFFFWALSTYLFLIQYQSRPKGMWLLLGLSIGCAFLSKYTAVFLPVSFFVFLVWEKRLKGHLAGIIGSFVVAILTFLPVIYWNLNNGLASFAFQSANRFDKTYAISFTDLLESQLLQAVFFTPLIFFGAIYILVRAGLEKEKYFSMRFLLSMAVPLIVGFAGISTLTWVKFNWTPPGYITALVLMGATIYKGYLEKTGWKKFMQASYIGIAVFIALALNGLSYFQPIYPRILPELSRANTMAGWKELSSYVRQCYEEMPEPERTFVDGYGYQIASELQFYGFREKEVYAQNIFGESALAFTFWQDTEPLRGQDAIVVTGEFEDFNPELLEQYFEKFEKARTYTLEIEGVEVRSFDIYKCYGYKGFNNALKQFQDDRNLNKPCN